MQFQTMSQLGDTLKGILQISKGSIHILQPKLVRGALMDRLAWTASFHKKGDMRGTARWIIKMTAAQLGIDIHSPQALCEALNQKEEETCTPSISLRGMVYGTARAIFRVARQREAQAFLFECPAFEELTAFLSPSQHIAVLAAAAIQEGFTGPLFIAKNPQEKAIKKASPRLFGESLEEIDSGLFRDLKDAKEKQEKNGGWEDVFLSREQYLWELFGKLQEKHCSKIAEQFGEFCDSYRIDRTKEAIMMNLPRGRGQSFSIREEIASAISLSARTPIEGTNERTRRKEGIPTRTFLTP